MLEVTVKTLDGKNRTFCVPDDVSNNIEELVHVNLMSIEWNSAAHEKVTINSVLRFGRSKMYNLVH